MTIKHFQLFFQSLQKKRADDLKRVEDAIARLNQRIEAVEKLVEEGNKLLKFFVSEMNQALFLQGQQKIELSQKRKLELKSELASENEKKRTVDNEMIFYSLFLFFLLFQTFLRFSLYLMFVFTSSTGRFSLSHFVTYVRLKPKSKCISCF